jgi:hypothetical protein
VARLLWLRSHSVRIPSKNFLTTHQFDVGLWTAFPCTVCRPYCPSRTLYRKRALNVHAVLGMRMDLPATPAYTHIHLLDTRSSQRYFSLPRGMDLCEGTCHNPFVAPFEVHGCAGSLANGFGLCRRKRVFVHHRWIGGTRGVLMGGKGKPCRSVCATQDIAGSHTLLWP